MLTGLLLATALAAPPPLTEGRHALLMHAATHSRLPVLGDRPGSSEAWVLVDVGPAGATGADAMQTPCTVQMFGAGERASVRLGPGFLEAMGSKQTRFALTPDAEGWAVDIDLGTDHVGYDPAVTGGALPQRANAPGVLDHEGDGNPGATVIVDVPVFGAMEIYIAQQAHTSLHGRVAEDGSLGGQLTGHVLEQRTLGATNPLMRVSPRMRPDPDRSHWWMVPVPSGTTCETVAAAGCAARGPAPGCPAGTGHPRRP